MITLLMVCTGNMCRSPLAAQLLRAQLPKRDFTVTSAGIRTVDGHAMPPPAQQLALRYGVDPEDVTAHLSRRLRASDLRKTDLILTMERRQRRTVAETIPELVRSIFTLREFARLAGTTTDAEIRDAVSGFPDAKERFQAAVSAVSAHRGRVAPPHDPDDDDIVDPYGRGRRVYERCARELVPAIPAVTRIARLTTVTSE